MYTVVAKAYMYHTCNLSFQPVMQIRVTYSCDYMIKLSTYYKDIPINMDSALKQLNLRSEKSDQLRISTFRDL